MPLADALLEKLCNSTGFPSMPGEDAAVIEARYPGFCEAYETWSSTEIPVSEKITGLLDALNYRLACDNDVFMHGQCHVLAVALHQITGLPMMAALEYDFDIEATALQHAWLAWTPENALDMNGVSPVKQVLSQFGGGAEVTEVGSVDLYALGGQPDEASMQLAVENAEKLLFLTRLYPSSGMATAQTPDL